MSSQISLLDARNVEHHLTDTLTGSWLLIYEGDNLVFRSDDRIAKIARHPDGRQRLQTGLTAAAVCATAGIRVVKPLHPELVETPAGPVSLWPYIEHRRLEAPNMTYEDGFQLGQILAALTQLPTDAGPPWDPLSRIPHRLATTKAPSDIVTTVTSTFDLVRETIALNMVNTQFAHGDISTENALFTTAGVFLIDLDSAGERPLGWDLACLDVHLVREHDNPVAFTGVLNAWAHTLPPVDLHTMTILKATMATTFLLTLTPTSARLAAITERCAEIRRWVAGDSNTGASLALGR